MLVKKKASKKKNTILISAAMLIFGVSFYVLYTTLFPPTEAPIEKKDVVIEKPTVAKAAIRSVEEDLDVNLFDSEGFQDLRVYGNVPVKIKSLGKKNPFGLK